MADKHRSLLATLTFPVALGLLGGSLLLGPVSAQADPYTSLPTVNITSAAGSAVAGQGEFGPRIEASFSAPGFSLGFGVPVQPEYFFVVAGDSLGAGFSFQETFGAPAHPGGTLTVNGTTYPVGDISAGVSGSVDSHFLTVPSGYATIQIPAALTGSGIACSELYPYYPSGCFAPPNVTQPILIANVNIDVPGYLTFTFAPAAGPAQNGETYSAVFTPTPEPVPAFLLLASLPILVLLRRRTTKWSS